MNLLVYASQTSRDRERQLAWGLLKLALSRELGIKEFPEVSLEKGGKPFFPRLPEIQFNLSHSHGGAVCAIHSLPVGVDIEKLRPAPRRLAGDLEDEPFFRLWTAKEATIKREGRGLAALLEPLEPDGLCRCLEDLLPEFIITVCPSEDVIIQTRRTAPEEAMRL